jgi:hypothetical protein
MHIMTDLDAIKTNNIRLFLLEKDLRHLISQFEVQCINFPEGADFSSYRPPSFTLWSPTGDFRKKLIVSKDGLFC